MSNWSDLETRINPAFTRVFGQDTMSYRPAASISNPYDIVLVIASPENIEGIEPAYCHAWAPANLFEATPQKGDRVVAADGREFVVFGVHPQTMDGELEPQTIWLSLNLA